MAQEIWVGNAQGFWGDSPDAPLRLARQAPHMEWLTLDYLAEVSMSILARQRERDASLGYARDFVEVVQSLAPLWKQARRPRLITNAGGLNPVSCAQACAAVLRKAGLSGMRMGIVWGDDVLEYMRAPAGRFAHLETSEPIENVRDRLVTANAYLGAAPLVEAIRRGADLVITGRVADPSLTVAPCVAQFGWTWEQYDRLAGATVAGHLIECGAQVTGGISTDWLEITSPATMGYPIAGIDESGSCVITTPPNTGGRVNERTVKEQLLYEIGDPARYPSPDATVSFLGLRVEDQGGDRVRVSGARGNAPPDTYKVSATYRAGFRASGTLTIVGRDAAAKARRCGQIVLDRLCFAGCRPEKSLVEVLGAGAVGAGIAGTDAAGLTEVVLRISVADDNEANVRRFTRELAPLITTGPQGVTGYAEGRPVVREVFGYWPTLIQRAAITPVVEMIEV